jgi:Uma2 family endonuclease
MSAMPILPIPTAQGWTVDDLDLLPDDGLRYELVEGTLRVSPPAPLPHNAVATELAVRLHPLLGPEWRVIAPAAVVFDRFNEREPDLLVVRRAGARGRHASPADVLLAVEVMSPSSRTDDRLVKPAQYAAAGIPHYWRIEPAVPVLVTYALADDAYRETGHHSDEVDLSEPVAVRFRLADLLA